MRPNFKNRCLLLDDTKRWRDILCSGFEKVNTVKTTILPKTTYRFNTAPYQINNGILQRTRKKLLTISIKFKKSQVTKTILRKENGVRGMKLLASNYTTSSSHQDSIIWHTENRST